MCDNPRCDEGWLDNRFQATEVCLSCSGKERMTFNEFLMSIRCPPNLALNCPGRPLTDDTDYITLYAMFRGPDSTGKNPSAQAMAARSFPIRDLNNITEQERAVVIVMAGSALKELWDHEFDEWFCVHGVPVHPPHRADGSFT